MKCENSTTFHSFVALVPTYWEHDKKDEKIITFLFIQLLWNQGCTLQVETTVVNTHQILKHVWLNCALLMDNNISYYEISWGERTRGSLVIFWAKYMYCSFYLSMFFSKWYFCRHRYCNYSVCDVQWIKRFKKMHRFHLTNCIIWPIKVHWLKNKGTTDL